MKNFLILLLLLLGAVRVHAAFDEYLSEQERYNRFAEGLDLWINSPIVLEDAIFFYYKGEGEEVYLSGEFNGWKRNLPMNYNETNEVWTLKWTERLDSGDYDYKLIVDDIWIADPYNTNSYLNLSGDEVSTFTLEDDFMPNKSYPLWIEGHTYRFYLDIEGANNVTLVGNFNHWNPYALPLENLGGGEWQLDYELPGGYAIYCFVVDGMWVPDPNNLTQYSDGSGNIVNVLFVEEE